MSNSTPNPSSSMFLFFLLTSVYFMIKYSGDPKQGTIYFGIYMLLLIIGEFIINVSLTKAMCGTNQMGSAMFITIIPWFLIFGMLNLVLMVFPGWLSPFSNTIGYGITKLFGINNLLNDIFKPKINSEDLKGENMGAMAEALEHIYNDRSLLVNEITQENFDNFWTNMSPSFKPQIKDNIEIKKRLFDFIRLKDIVAEYIWYMLTGMLVTSVGYNYLVNKGCTQSVEDIKQRHKAYEAKEKFIAQAKANGAPPRVYSTRE
jgi:hypothetical protein